MSKKYRIIVNGRTIVTSLADSDKEVEIVKNLCRIISKRFGIGIEVVVENE